MAVILPGRRHFVVLGSFMCYFIGISSLQIIGIYMTSLSDEFNVSTAVLGLMCGFGVSLQLMLGIMFNFLSFPIL